MNSKLINSLLAGSLCGMLLASTVRAEDDVYQVTITNLTRGTLFTPVLVVSHKRGLKLFTAGTPASEGLAQLAEGGATAPLLAELEASGKVVDSAVSDPLPPGASVTVQVSAAGKSRYLSLASMMLPTNDGFIALNGVRVAGKGGPRSFHVAGYDAGTEHNDELCGSIPGPHCGGEGFNAESGEGYVHIHAGLHGIGNLVAADRDWRNPVARVRVERID